MNVIYTLAAICMVTGGGGMGAIDVTPHLKSKLVEMFEKKA